VSNLLTAIKTARYFEMDRNDIVLTVATDSADMYRSRLAEMEKSEGAWTAVQAEKTLDRCLYGQKTDHFAELGYRDRKRIHNLKYYTWIEQQGKESADLNTLWEDRTVFEQQFAQTEKWDELIREFNDRAGLLKKL
jgi:hypothetical protein